MSKFSDWNVILEKNLMEQVFFYIYIYIFFGFYSSDWIRVSRFIPVELTTHTSSNIVGICKTIRQLSRMQELSHLSFVPIVADVAIVYKWWLRAFSRMDLGQELTSRFVFYFSSWHPFKAALKLIWLKGIFYFLKKISSFEVKSAF